MTCSVHRGKIRGRVHYWHHQPMCGACYARFTSKVRLAGPRPVRAPKRPGGVWSRVRRLFGG